MSVATSLGLQPSKAAVIELGRGDIPMTVSSGSVSPVNAAGAAKPAEGTPQHPNCRQCHHFAISWDADRPYACRAFGFKTRILPSWEVYRADGSDCKLFSPKP